MADKVEVIQADAFDYLPPEPVAVPRPRHLFQLEQHPEILERRDTVPVGHPFVTGDQV